MTIAYRERAQATLNKPSNELKLDMKEITLHGQDNTDLVTKHFLRTIRHAKVTINRARF